VLYIAFSVILTGKSFLFSMELLGEHVSLCYHSKGRKRGNDDCEYVGSLCPKGMLPSFLNVFSLSNCTVVNLRLLSGVS